ncbi:MAG: ankyrin repeat domain-containing protein, partial [Bdellovibrionota bacterium]
LAAHPAITAANIEKGVSTLMSLSSQTEATSTLALALLARGAPLNYQDPKDQRTALMLAIERNRPFISLTLAQAPGLDRTLVDRYKTNLLHFAAIAKDHAVLDLLLKDTSMPVNAVNDYRNTPLLYAASANDPLSISLLGTRLDLDPNPVNSYNGFTPLIEAAQRGLYPAVQALLLLKGIDKERRDLKGYTALMWAVKNGHHDVAKLLEQVK